MTFGGVPILDWVILVVLLGLGVEAYITTRNHDDKEQKPNVETPSADPAQVRSRDDAES